MSHSILIVDDSVALAQFLEKKVKESLPNCKTQVVRLAGEAYHSAVSDRPDLVLIDYALPDLKGDEICRLLYHNPVTALTPVILFYGDGIDVTRIQAANPNIVAALQKPFRPEILMVEIERIFSQPRIALEIKARFDAPTYKDLGIATSKVLFRANTMLFPLCEALRHIGEEKLSGVLRVVLKKNPIEVYCLEGRICMATTKDLQLYSIDSPVQLSKMDRESVATAAKGQMDSACPYFILLALRGAIPEVDLPDLVKSHSKRLMGRAFLAAKLAFEFEDLNALPEFVRGFTENADEPVKWAFQCLREIPVERVAGLGLYDLGDTPAYSPQSFKLLETLELDPAEASYASVVNGATPLSVMASELALTENEIVALHFRFAMSGIVDLWPASVFERAAESE